MLVYTWLILWEDLGLPDVSTGTAGGITVWGDGLIVKDYNNDGNLDVCNAQGAAAANGYSIFIW
ncbi:MAG: hypothetical protein IPF75_17020 [Bacteroidetes bacterium]|nr:hypothetical protein [Bacteroidota bacterium]